MEANKKTLHSCKVFFNFCLNQSALKGIKEAILARLIAVEISLWCFAQVPVIRRGRILPPSAIKRFSF